MLISYHIKAELCTLFDKVHKAFINSANAPRLCAFYRLPTVCPSADTAAQPVEARLALPGRGMFAMTWRGIAAARRRGDCRDLPAETKGGKGTVWFPCPLLTPPNPPSDATPCGRASKSEGPTGACAAPRVHAGSKRSFSQRNAAALHRMAAHCYARQPTQSKFRA